MPFRMLFIGIFYLLTFEEEEEENLRISMRENDNTCREKQLNVCLYITYFGSVDHCGGIRLCIVTTGSSTRLVTSYQLEKR